MVCLNTRDEPVAPTSRGESLRIAQATATARTAAPSSLFTGCGTSGGGARAAAMAAAMAAAATAAEKQEAAEVVMTAAHSRI